MDDEIDLRAYFDVIRRRWKAITFISIGLVAAALIFSLLQKPVYEASTTILVRSNSGSSLSQYAGIAGMVGIKLPSGGGGGISDLTELIQSKAVAARVIDQLKLRERINAWDDPKLSDHKLASSVSHMLKKPKSSGNLVELVVEYNDPKLSAEIANAFAEAFSFYWNELNYTEARKKREYIDGQLPRVEKELTDAEQKLKKFTMLAPRGSDSTSNLMGLVAGSQSQGIEVSRLMRELDIQNSVYTMLRKEYESVKLEESKEIQSFSVVDEAIVPERPSKPRIKLNMLFGLVLGIFSGIFVAFFQEYWDKSGGK